VTSCLFFEKNRPKFSPTHALSDIKKKISHDERRSTNYVLKFVFRTKLINFAHPYNFGLKVKCLLRVSIQFQPGALFEKLNINIDLLEIHECDFTTASSRLNVLERNEVLLK
jgi:hypothetical protein